MIVKENENEYQSEMAISQGLGLSDENVGYSSLVEYRRQMVSYGLYEGCLEMSGITLIQLENEMVNTKVIAKLDSSDAVTYFKPASLENYVCYQTWYIVNSLWFVINPNWELLSNADFIELQKRVNTAQLM
jgi:hypothetical protein